MRLKSLICKSVMSRTGIIITGKQAGMQSLASVSADDGMMGSPFSQLYFSKHSTTVSIN